MQFEKLDVSQKTASQTFVYRPEIDGLRAVAVLSVLMFHAFPQLLPGGFVGVDIFFVISGYLITSILVAELRSDKISFISFYERRARRLLPPLLPVLIVTIGMFYLVLNKVQFADFVSSLKANAFFISNWYFLKSVSYFEAPSVLTPILHTWSLSVEEQFYFVFPAILILVSRVNRALVLPAVAVLAVCSFCYSLFLMSDGEKDVAFYSSAARFWEILVGSVLAAINRNELSKAAANLLECIGAALIVIAIFTFGHATAFPGAFALIPTIGAALLIYTAGKGVVSITLASKPMVSIGLLSYALYLWHWPLMAAVRVLNPTPEGWLMAIVLIASAILAWISYIVIERPIRSKRMLSGRGGVWSWALIVIAGSYMAGMYFSKPKAAAHQESAYIAASKIIYPEAKVEILDRIEKERKFYMQALNLNYTGGLGEYDDARFKGWTCSFDQKNTIYKLTECLLKQSADDNVLVMGDSIGRDTTHALRMAFPGKNFIMLHQSSCPPGASDVCFKGQREILLELSSKVKISAVIISFRYRPSDYRNVEPGIEEAKRITPNVYLFGLSPMFSLSITDYLKSLPMRVMPSDIVKKTDGSMLSWDLDMLLAEAKAIAEREGVKFVNVLPFFCESGVCYIWVNNQYGDPLYFDQQHLTARGIKSFSSYLKAKPELADFL